MEKNKVSPLHDPTFDPPPYSMPQGQPDAPPPPVGFLNPGPGQQQQYPQPPMIQVMTMPNLGPGATRMTCPHCRAEVTTSVKHQTSCMTHLAAGVLCLLGLWCCVCIPYCTDSCMDAEHECPNCNKFIGTFRR